MNTRRALQSPRLARRRNAHGTSLAPFERVRERLAVHRGWKIAGAVVAVIVLLLVAVSFFGDAPLRDSIEKRMNAKLKGYKASVGHAHLSVFGLSITLRNVSVAQNAHPDPPVMVLPYLKASVHWKELATLHLVADFLFRSPKLHVNRPQLMEEAQDPTPVKEKGWQEAFESIYPLKINLLRITDGDVTYIDAEDQPPLTIQKLEFHATNIRNIHSKSHVYPSPFEAKAVLMGSGRGSLEGHANFLAEPFPGIHALFDLAEVPLAPFKSLVQRSNLIVKDGVLSTNGEAEIAPDVRFVDVKALDLKRVRLDYLHTAATSGAEAKKKEDVKKAVQQASSSPKTDLRLEKLTLTDCELGFVNKAKSPPYRLFLAGTNLEATNFSDNFKNGPATVKVTGRFMGTGPSNAHATFRPPVRGPDFDLRVAINDTQMTGMNDLLRAYGKFDVAAGLFSFFCELNVKNGAVDGYVKPLFRDMQVYDPGKDADKGALRKLYEKVVDGVAKLLRNKARKEVATETRISGPISSPKTSILEVVTRLVENAFFRAILPGFDFEIFRARHGGEKETKKAA